MGNLSCLSNSSLLSCSTTISVVCIIDAARGRLSISTYSPNISKMAQSLSNLSFRFLSEMINLKLRWEI
jgi:hypothetical protein